jgi:hypothetical protein
MEKEKLFNISLIIRNNSDFDDDFTSGTYKLDFTNSNYRITGDYFIIETKKDEELLGSIHPIKTIKSYKIWQ